MQEPCNISDVIPYGTMLDSARGKSRQDKGEAGSPALQEVEDIIQATSYGKPGLQDVNVVDVNMLCSSSFQERRNFPDLDLKEAQELCLEIVRLIAPKFALILTCVARQSSVKAIRLFSSSLKGGGITARTSIGEGEACHSFTIIKGFHPSIFLGQDYIEQRSWGDNGIRCAKEMLPISFRKAVLKLNDEGSCGKDSIVERASRCQCG